MAVSNFVLKGNLNLKYLHYFLWVILKWCKIIWLFTICWNLDLKSNWIHQSGIFFKALLWNQHEFNIENRLIFWRFKQVEDLYVGWQPNQVATWNWVKSGYVSAGTWHFIKESCKLIKQEESYKKDNSAL